MKMKNLVGKYKLFYLLIEFNLYSSRIFLDNTHFLDGYFKDNKIYEYDECYIFYIYEKTNILI